MHEAYVSGGKKTPYMYGGNRSFLCNTGVSFPDTPTMTTSDLTNARLPESTVPDDCDESVVWPERRDPTMAEKLSDHLQFNNEVTFTALLAFAAVDEFGSFKAAADYLQRTPQGLRKAITNLAKALSVSDLLKPEASGRYRASGRVAEELRELARTLMYQYGSISRLGDDNIRIRYLPQHGFFMAAVEARLDGLVNMHPKTLGEEDRSITRFQDEVIAALAGGAIDLAIGLPPRDGSDNAKKLRTHYLYSSRQEAMVAATDPRDAIALTELLDEGKLLVPPINTRSRERLEHEIKADVPNPPDSAQWVKREAYGTKVLIQYGMKGLGAVVVPSDIAHVFHHGNDYGGSAAARFKWIPLCRSSREFIYQPVYAITRRARDRRSDQLQVILSAIQKEVSDLGLEKNNHARHP
jgi:DNA-binding transcriptional LysR family regulator